MNTRRAAKRRVEEDISNTGARPQGNQDSPKEQVHFGGQASQSIDHDK